MTILIEFEPTAVAKVVKAPKVAYTNTVTLGKDPEGGTVTGGTATIRAKASGAAEFEDFTPNTIDFSAPERLEIKGAVDEFEITIVGFAGTASKVYLGFDAAEV